MNFKQHENFVIQGPIIHSLSSNEIGYYENATIVVKKGKIVSFDSEGKIKVSANDGHVIKLINGQFLCPGLIDLHIHAPQYPNIGLGMDMPLLDWLKAYTFPLEVKYGDLEFASKVYRYVVKSTLSCGTTMAVYYGSMHCGSTIKLAEIISELGQRAIVGKAAMNRNIPIDNYTEETTQCLEHTQKVADCVKNLKNPLVETAVTPRFAITCDMPLLQSLAKMAVDQDLYIQTHISENKTEVEVVKELYPECIDYTDVYDKAGILTNKTILAHGIYLSDRELDVLKERGTCIAHCPNSNTYLQSGLCDVRKLWNHGVKVGLGTDVSGGCNASIVDAMRCALATSTHLSFQIEGYKPLNFQEVFYLATLGGATALGMENKIGSFAVGKDFDALVVDMMPLGGTAGVMLEHTLKEHVQKFIYCGETKNVKQVFVEGKLVHSK
uniref:Guanine deaminase n=1 Tax=Limnogonus franciscanus TaxID=913166 RepID=A0A5C1YTJ0_9HEMI|nr:DhpD [Limnogonus franciscanus]